MKHLLSILIFFSFMSVASAEAKFNQPDNPDREIDYLGITVETVSSWHVDKFESIYDKQIGSVIIVDMSPASFLAKQGIEIGDIIIKAQGKELSSGFDLQKIVNNLYNVESKENILLVFDVGKNAQKFIGAKLDDSLVSRASLAEKKEQEEIIKIKNLELIEIEKEKKLAEKKAKINQMKLDCEDLGFTKDTEGMGNCVLKLMELDRGNTVTTSYSSGSNKEILDIEREKLEALKAQTEEARRQADEAKRQADEAKEANRREGLKDSLDQIKKGSCIMTRSDYWNC